MEMFQIIFLTVAVSAQVSPPTVSAGKKNTGTQFQIPKLQIAQKPSYEVLYDTENVTLECMVHEHLTDLQYEWYKDSTSLKLPLDQAIILVNTSGQYECKVKKNATESEKSDFKTLNLQAIPTAKLTLEPALAVFYPSEKVTLKCEIEDSSDDWSYKWYKNKGFLQESKSKLEITLTSKNDSGEYTCQRFIKDRVTTEMSSAVTLQINAIPTAKLTLEPALAVFYPSEKVTLKCEIEDSSDDWSYKWYKNEGFLQESKSPLEIKLTSKNDSEEYTCQRFIKDRVTTEMSSAVTLQINAIPTAKLTLEPALAVFYPSEKVTLKCEIEDSSDDWSYKWYKNEGFLQESKSPLEIKLTSKNDSEEYTCQRFIKDRVTTEMSSAVTLQINAIPTAKLTLEPALAVFYPSEKVTLKCEIEDSSDDWSYKWYKNEGFLQESKSPLEIKLTSKNDSGEYTCQRFIKDRVTTEMSSAVTLHVNAIPTAKLTLEPALAVFYPSEKVTLKCEIEDSSDDWSYKWYKNEGFLQESKSPLEIKLTSKNDSEEYTCQRFIKDRVTTEMSSAVTLQINAIPTAKLTLEPALAVFYPSEKVTLKCEIEDSSDDWSYKWYKNEGFLQESKSPLEIKLTSKNDSEEYTCQRFIKDRVTTEMSSAVTLQINAIPTAKLTLEPALAVFYPSEKVTLKCEIEDSSDDWSYKWYKNEGFLQESKSPLEIKLTSKNDSGEYTCQRFIKDRVTTEMSSAVTLHVNAIPTAKLTLEPALAVFYPSEKVTLKCEIEDSSDDWSYKWYKNKGFLQESKSPLEITLKSKNDSEEYTCQRFIKDRVTTEMSSAVTLQVNETPRPNLTADPNWTEFFPNETITLTCGFDGNSDGWSFEWLKINETLKTSSTLTITAKLSDSGQYSCKGKLRSMVTQQSDAFQLNVKDQWPKPNLTQSQNVEVLYKGETITFNCKVEVRSPNWEYLFFRDSVQIHADTSNSFSIASVQVSHSGKYLCQVKRRTLTSGQSDVRTVTVKEIPKAQLKSEWTDAFPGETVSLQCVIPGVSENWIYMWFRNEKIVSSGPDTNVYGNTLSLSVKPHHTGLYMYVCRAQLEGRSVKSAKSTQHSLNIYGTRPTIILKQDPQYPEIYTGEQVKLKCSIQEQTSKWAYQWKKDESVQGIQGDTYTIQSATLSHNGLYTCHISRNGVTFSSESKKCTIIEPPQPKLSIESEWKMFYPTEKITLKCSINANPNDWRYEWYKNESPLPEAKDTLLINSADISHNGSYKCKAKHGQRLPVTTSETQALQIHISDPTPKPDIKIHPTFEFFYTDERIHLDCNMSGDGWEYHWYKDSNPTQPSITNTNYTINSASLHHTGVYKCEAKRGDFSISSGPLKVEVQARLPAVLALVTELSDIMAGNVLTLRCEVSDGKEWNYTWSENGQELNESSHTLKVKATEDTIKNEFKCRGKRTVRPLYSSWSEEFVAKNIVFKRKILLAISGFFICCIVILIIGCITLKITHKPVKKETACEDLFISMADSKNQATTPLMEYMENKPTENESEEKEELNMDHISVTHVDGVIKGDDSPSAEANGLTSFKGA